MNPLLTSSFEVSPTDMNPDKYLLLPPSMHSLSSYMEEPESSQLVSNFNLWHKAFHPFWIITHLHIPSLTNLYSHRKMWMVTLLLNLSQAAILRLPTANKISSKFHHARLEIHLWPSRHNYLNLIYSPGMMVNLTSFFKKPELSRTTYNKKVKNREV